MVRAKDPRLHCISVAYEGFVVPEGVLLLISTPFTQPLHVATLSTGVPSLSPILQEGEEKEEEQEEEGFVDLTKSTDEFEVFNQPSSPKNLPDEMGIQRSLQELLESQPGRGESGKFAQPRLPPPSPRYPPRVPQPTLPSRTKQVDPKKRRE